MSLIVEDGTGVAGAESYQTVALADTYLSTKRGLATTYATWTAATTATKEALLRWSTRLIDKLWAWDGSRVLSTQALRWPREDCLDDEGDEIVSTTIPQDLKDAVCEMAWALLQDPTRADDQETGLASGNVGSLQAVFDKFDRASVLPKPVKFLLSSLGTSKASSSRPVMRS